MRSSTEMNRIDNAVVMILRVWAMYDRSRIILGALLTLYATEAVVCLVYCIMESTRIGTLGMTWFHNTAPRSHNTMILRSPSYSGCQSSP